MRTFFGKFLQFFYEKYCHQSLQQFKIIIKYNFTDQFNINKFLNLNFNHNRQKYLSKMQLSTQNAFQVIFPKYIQLLTQSPLYTDDGLQTFVRDELPHKIELVRSIESTFLSFQTQFTNLILKRPKQQNLIQSLALKASQKIEKLFYQLETSSDKQVSKTSLNNELAFMNIQEIRTRFREQLKDVGPLLKEKYFDSHHLDKDVEEHVARRLYCLSELYYFLKNDITSIAARFRVKEHEVLNEINKPASTGANTLEISSLLYLDQKLIQNIGEMVDKRYRPFLGKKDFFYSKVKQIENESQSKVPMNIHTLVQSILSKEKYRSNKEITAALSKQLKTLDQSLEQQIQKDCKQIITQVDSLKKEFNQLKNNVFYLDIIRGTFTQKYKMQLNKLENIYYLSNIQKYLQDVQTFTEKLIRVEERIIDNRKGFMKRLGKDIQDKIATVTTDYEVRNSDNWRTLADLIDSQFTALKDNLYGIVGDSQTNPKSISNKNLQTLKQQKVNELEKRRIQLEKNRQEKQYQRKRQLEEKAQKQRLKRQQDRIKLQEKRRAEDQRIRKMKQQRQEAERIRKIQQAQKQKIRQVQMEEKRKQTKLKEQEQRQRVREQMKRKQQQKKRKQAEDAKLREKLKSQKEIQQKRRIQQAQNKRRQAQQMKRSKQQQQKLQQQRQREEKERVLKIKRQQEQRQQKQRQQRLQQQKQERQRRQRQLKAQRDREEQQRKDQQQRQRRQRQGKLQRERQEKEFKEQQQRQRKERQRLSQLERQKAEAQERQRDRIAKLQKEKRQRQQKQKRQKQQRQRNEREQREKRDKKQRQQREQRARKQQEERDRKQKDRRQKEEKDERERQQKLAKEKLEKQKRQKEQKQKQRREKQEQQRKQRQRKQQLQRQKKAKQNQQKQRLQKQKKIKQQSQRQAKLKQQQQKKRKQQAERERKQLQLLMQQQENIKKNKSKVSNDRKSKNGSGINYDDLDDIIDDDLEELDQKDLKVNKAKKNAAKEDEDYGDDYEDDFESPEKDQQGSGTMIEPKELITAESVKCLNDYMKGTAYARKNKPNLQPFNNNQSYAYLFQEFMESKKLFIFDSAVSKAVLDFSKQLMDQNANEQDLKISIDEIKDVMFNDYANKFQEESFDPRTVLVLPFSFPNVFDLKLIEFLPQHAWFRPVIAREIAEEETEAFNSLLQGLLHIFEIQNDPQVQSVVIPQASRMVLQTFDKDLPCLLLIFAMHYETQLKQEIQITQYTVERFFYTIQVLKPYYEAIQNNQQQLVKFYQQTHEKYSENEPVRILPIELENADPEYQAKLQQYAVQAKHMFIQDTKINTLLILFQVLIATQQQQEEEQAANFQKVSIYCSLQRTNPKPTVSYFIVSKDDVDKENASMLFDIVSEGDDSFEVNVFMDFTRHNGLNSYSDWTLPLWARSIQKRKLSAVNAFRAIAFAMTPYFVAFREQD